MKYFHIPCHFIPFLFTVFFSCNNSMEEDGLDSPFKPWNYSEALAKEIDSELTSGYMNSRPPRIVADLKADWTFNYFPESQENENIATWGFDDSQWPAIAIPHTWQTFETTGDIHPYIKNPSEQDDPYWWKGWGYYRKRFQVNAELKDRKVFIEFDGVQKYAKVYVNGKFVGDHKGGLNSFSFDITSILNWGEENTLVVMVNNFRRDRNQIPPMTAGNWNVYGGIYRDVRLVIKNKVHIPYQGAYDHEGGTFVTTPEVSAESAKARVITYVRNDSEIPQSVSLSTIITDPDGNTVTILQEEKNIEPNTTVQYDQTTEAIDNPGLWHPESPTLYKVVSRISIDGSLQDTYESPLGFRYFHWDFENDDLFVNGQRINIQGTNRHQEYPWLGDAIPKWIQIRDLYDIRFGLGHNFMRATHYPNDPLIYDLADQLGIIMVEEVPNIKDIDFNEEVQEQNVREMIRRDRNHPSIFFWSMGNETNDGADSKWAVEEDTTRLIHSRKAEGTGDFVDHDHTNLDMENLLRVTIRGWFTQDDVEGDIDSSPENGQHASSEAWQHQMAMERGGSVRGILNNNTMAWLYEDHGADREYKNSPVLHINSKGWVDNYRIPKYIYYLTKANYTEEPVLFIHPHYWRRQYLGQTKDLVLDSNFDEVEIIVNGVSKGRVYPGKTDFNSLTIKNIKIEEGTLLARGKKDGNAMEVELTMPTKPHRIWLESTHKTLPADRSGLAIITAYVLDSVGTLVFDSKNPLKWEVSGPAGLVRYENYVSDLTKKEAMEGTGYLLGPVSNVIRTTKQAGEISVKVSSPGLGEAEIRLVSSIPKVEQNGIVQPELSDQNRLKVERAIGFVENISYMEIIGRITQNQQFGGSRLEDYRQEIDSFILRENSGVGNFPLGYGLLLDQLAKNLLRLEGSLIADDYNFLAEQFNRYAMLSDAIDAANLNLIYSQTLKDYYAMEVLGQNRQIDFEEEVNLIRAIPQNHVPLYIRQPDGLHAEGQVVDDYVSKTFTVWSENVINGIESVFPSYADLSGEERIKVFTYIARITPYVEYDPLQGSFTFIKDVPLIIPDPDVRTFLPEL